MHRKAGCRLAGCLAGMTMAAFVVLPAAAQTTSLDWDQRGCVFGPRPGLDRLVPGYNPGAQPYYCPPPAALYPAPPVAAPTASLYLSAPSRSYCLLRSSGLMGDSLSQLAGSLCRDDSALWALAQTWHPER
ncbi:hypothetical protein JJL56_06840 [Azospirillum sp. YIM DDC1]|uniref:Uncharacterized protein n=1 Tax=Azospirillum aestuarii TaxID=2802052 RepID=A0ABS1HUS4_9PROT|nr:hypothetical protein [Azospirillum aestuarii]MBK3775011.1 hypothetical protein [Azospirillum brasilense]MBK4718580.1 hypothetical protein [Azospirillum aestuarii]TWA95200.1 hypothetical protein FBY14_101438 [Azospirillum brasilense]